MQKTIQDSQSDILTHEPLHTEILYQETLSGLQKILKKRHQMQIIAKTTIHLSFLLQVATSKLRELTIFLHKTAALVFDTDFFVMQLTVSFNILILYIVVECLESSWNQLTTTLSESRQTLYVGMAPTHPSKPQIK